MQTRLHLTVGRIGFIPTSRTYNLVTPNKTRCNITTHVIGLGGKHITPINDSSAAAPKHLPRHPVAQPYRLYNKIINTITNSSEPQQETNTLNNSRRSSGVSGAKHHKLLGLITTNLSKSELTKCCGELPIEQSTGKLISHLLTQEQIGVLERHRALMREVIRQYRQSKDGNKQSNVDGQ